MSTPSQPDSAKPAGEIQDTEALPPVATEPLSIELIGKLPALLAQLRTSLLVTTYQAGKLIVLRADGAGLNAHFRSLRKPMGLATDGRRMMVGSATEIVEYRNMPAVCDKLEPKGKHDACYVHRSSWVTGNIDIHEMSLDAEGVLWFINTRFSCLCTLDGSNSFVPRWRPTFVKGLGPEDRCHLNGLAMRDGVPRYVTALGESDAERGWRANKANGGVLIDIQSGRTLCRGLSMPHSPRWHAGQLWVLESGKGTLEKVDPTSGRRETIATLPGFTRGLDFVGPLAFIGLSQVRETAIFSGIPITEHASERNCGVWVVNVETREILSQLRFKSGVHEIFAVQTLDNQCFPEILPAHHPLVATSYALPKAALSDVKPPFAPSQTTPAVGP